jgi:hypothetical protein
LRTPLGPRLCLASNELAQLTLGFGEAEPRGSCVPGRAWDAGASFLGVGRRFFFVFFPRSQALPGTAGASFLGLGRTFLFVFVPRSQALPGTALPARLCLASNEFPRSQALPGTALPARLCLASNELAQLALGDGEAEPRGSCVFLFILHCILRRRFLVSRNCADRPFSASFDPRRVDSSCTFRTFRIISGPLRAVRPRRHGLIRGMR